ncbi:obstructor-F [Cochliomyia hominivorax]
MLIIIFILTFGGPLMADMDLTKLCMDQDFGAVLAHPRNCSGYIVCNEKPSIHYCELGFHFDGKTKICNFPENVKCELKSASESESIHHSFATFMALDVMTGNIVDPLQGFEPDHVVCQHFGAYFLPNPQQCRSYYLCAFGHMLTHSCGLGTLWDYRKQQCLPNHQAICYYKTPDEEQEILEYIQSCNPSTSTTATTASVFHPTGSSYTRTTEELTTATIPTTTTSSLITKSTTTTPPTTPTRPQIHSSKRPNSSHPFYITCPPKRQSYVAHPKDCSKYFMCIMGTPVMTSCPTGLMWDSKKEYCDLAKNVKCFQ